MLPITRTAGFRLASSLHRQAHISPAYLRGLSSLAVLEQRNGQVNASSISSIAAARVLGGSVTAFIAGSSVKDAAGEVAKLEGVDKVVYVQSDTYEKSLPESFASLLAENIKKDGYTHVLASHSAFGKNILPRLAAIMDKQQISDVTKIESENTFVRPIYAGNAILTVESRDDIKILTVRETAFPGTSVGQNESSAAATVSEGVDPKPEPLSQWLSEDFTRSDRPDLGSARRVVSGGQGLKSKEDFDRIITPLADVLGAAIGASRAAVDSGYADNSLQVGQTGKNVAPDLYLSVGISGAIQHLAGMKDSKVIVAINKDPDAPIFQVADVGLVANLFNVVPELTEKLKKA